MKKTVYFCYVMAFVIAIVGGFVAGRYLVEFILSRNEMVEFFFRDVKIITLGIPCILAFFCGEIAFIKVASDYEERRMKYAFSKKHRRV